jgi:hypothetical protein
MFYAQNNRNESNCYKIYLLGIIGNLINKTKRATFPYPTFFLDALYLKLKIPICTYKFSSALS